MKYGNGLLFLVAFLASTVLSAQPKGLEKYVARIVYQEIDFKNTPGIIVGVVDGDSSFVFSHGNFDFGSSRSLDAQTVFELGSVSKVFTASLLQILIDNNVLSYDDTVSKYYQFPRLQFEGEEVTVGDLASHLSGLPKLPFNFGIKEKDPRNPYANYSEKDLLDFLENYYLSKKPGMEYNYSHAGYVLLSLIMEKATGKKYMDLLKEYVIGPLNLNSTQVDNALLRGYDFAPGYSLAGLKAPLWTFKCFEPSMGLKSNMEDLMKFCRAQFSSDNPLYESLVKTQKNIMQTDRKKVSVARGWHLVQARKNYYPVVVHSGATEGHRIFMAFVRETQTAVIVLTNSEHNHGGVGGYILQFINQNFKRK